MDQGGIEKSERRNSGPESALKRAKDACGICTRTEMLERVVAKSNKNVARFRRPFFEYICKTDRATVGPKAHSKER